jgi:hypothetical protein
MRIPWLWRHSSEEFAEIPGRPVPKVATQRFQETLGRFGANSEAPTSDVRASAQATTVSSLSLWRRWLWYGSDDVGASGREEGNQSRELWFYSARGSIPGRQQPPPEIHGGHPSFAELCAHGRETGWHVGSTTQRKRAVERTVKRGPSCQWRTARELAR